MRLLRSLSALLTSLALIAALPAAGASLTLWNAPFLSGGTVAYAADDPAERSDLYRDGRRALDDGRWGDAVASFDRLAREGGEDADAALYWKAYAQHKAGDQGAALATLKKLEAEHRGSAWLDDAKALELEMRGGSGRAVSPQGGEDEDLKLLAIDGLMQMDEERAVPLLERFLAGDHPPSLKKRALFVLGQTDSPRAAAILGAIARGERSPELQEEAIEMLGVSGAEDAVRVLGEVYRATSNPEVKAAVLQSYLVTGEAEPVLAAATGEKDPGLRRRAIHVLGAMGAEEELRTLLRQASSPDVRVEVLEAMGVAGDEEGLLAAAREEKDPRVRRRAIQGLGVAGADEALQSLLRTESSPELRIEVLQAMGVAGDVAGLTQAAREDKDPQVRRRAIQGLGVAGGDESYDTLSAIYRSTSDRDTKEAVIEALFVGGGSKELIAIFRAEKDRELKREVLQKLSMMDDDEVQALLMDVLEKD